MINYSLEKTNDVDLIKKYKSKTVFQYAEDLSEEEKIKINRYIDNNVLRQIDDYHVIKCDDKIVGCVLVNNYKDGVLLDEIYIDEDYRNKGIGTSIIKNILDNNAIVYLWVYKKNIEAFNLYNRIGFNIFEETDTRYLMRYI